MTEVMILVAVVLLLCVFSSKILYRYGIPALLIFLVLGMVFGSDGIVGIYFDNYEIAKQVCSVGLLFIMFYGGFCTNWKIAKPVIIPSILMSTMGVIITACLTGLFCYYVLNLKFMESMLLGSITASTDAASVFAILRSRNLNLKGGLASLLEIESGSNDPIAYMLVIIILTLMSHNTDQSIIVLLVKQVGFGLTLGFLIAKLTIKILKYINFEVQGLYPILLVAVAILSYSLSEYMGGNGYLCVYIVGIMVGNSKVPYKKTMIQFFDGISWLMQIMIFFILGLLSFPSMLPQVFVPGVLVSLFMIFVARPIATFSILSWFKVPVKQQIFVSWVGLRGAAAIVFAIYAVTNNVTLINDIFHIVFFIALFSVAVQGTLLPAVAKKLDLVENESLVIKTFNDYQEETNTKLIEVTIDKDSNWANKTIKDAKIPLEILVVMIKRQGNAIVPKGSTVIYPGDTLVLSGPDFEGIVV